MAGMSGPNGMPEHARHGHVRRSDTVDRNAFRPDLRHVVRDDGGDDGAERRSDHPDLRHGQPAQARAGPALRCRRRCSPPAISRAWGAFSLAATFAQWGLERAALMTPMMETTSAILGGALFVAAGLYQFTPVKYACLEKCRSPLDFVLNNWREGRRGALSMGLRHGFFCLGCCWVGDAPDVRRRRDEPAMGRSDGRLRSGREARALRPVDRPHQRRRDACVRRLPAGAGW